LAPVKPLPAPLEIVPTPTYLHTSRVAAIERCLWRAVLGSLPNAPALIGHPAAELGKVAHVLMERAARGQIERTEQAEIDVRREFERVLRDTKQRLASDPSTRSWADLSRVWEPLSWRRKLRRIIDAAVAVLSAEASGVSAESGRGTGRLTYDNLSNRGHWNEIPIAVAEYRLDGRMDVVKKTAGQVTIRDLKSGRVEDRDGQILPHLERQMHLYGAMVSLWSPDTEVQLIIDDGSIRTIPYDDLIEAETLAFIRQITRKLPAPGAEACAADFAQTGPDCAWCVHRHVCSAYRADAPIWWKGPVPHPIQRDIWGVVQDVSHGPADTLNVQIRDGAGRIVRIFGVDEHHVGGASVGDEIWFFGLEAQDRGSHTYTGHCHPRNFWEIHPGDPRARAWTAQIFTQTD
jgi:hypothetical protein